MGTFLKAALKSQIPEGSGLPVVLGDAVVAVFHADGGFFALDNSCPHRGASLGMGAIEKGKVICPWHGWEFDLKTGNLAMSEGVRSYPVRVEGDEIWVEV